MKKASSMFVSRLSLS